MPVHAPLHVCEICRKKHATFHDKLKLCDRCYVKDNPQLSDKVRKYLLDRDGRTPELPIDFEPKRWSINYPSKRKQKKHKE